MKSAYELAMERLNSEDPQEKTLTDEQKLALSEIDEKYRAKAAEREIFLEQKLTGIPVSSLPVLGLVKEEEEDLPPLV